MPYWQAPERLFDEPDEFADWAREAFDVAVRTKKPGKKTAAKKPAARKTPAKKRAPAKKRS
jgi:DNA transformation protein